MIEVESVRPLELFFDLVFVFAITQIASLLVEMPTWSGLLRVVLMLAVIWWMYGGYAWLTNSLNLEQARPRLLLLVGMGAFFVASLAVPREFESGPWALVLGVAYLVVVTIHTVGFLGTSGRAGITRIGPLNVISGLLVLVAGIVPPGVRLWVLGAAAGLQVISPFLAGISGFTVGVGHFVERHGLAVIIVLGESLVEVGSAGAHQHSVSTVVLGALLALAVSAAMWWLYFDREERDSVALLERIPAQRRPRAALYSFGYAYLALIAGIAVTAVGMQKAIDSFTASMCGLPSALIPLGVAAFLIGLGCFHRALAGRWPVLRLFGAVAVVIAWPAARLVGGAAALATTAAVLVGIVVTEARRAR